jgi:hypothetical protein
MRSKRSSSARPVGSYGRGRSAGPQRPVSVAGRKLAAGFDSGVCAARWAACVSVWRWQANLPIETRGRRERPERGRRPAQSPQGATDARLAACACVAAGRAGEVRFNYAPRRAAQPRRPYKRPLARSIFCPGWRDRQRAEVAGTAESGWAGSCPCPRWKTLAKATTPATTAMAKILVPSSIRYCAMRPHDSQHWTRPRCDPTEVGASCFKRPDFCLSEPLFPALAGAR